MSAQDYYQPQQGYADSMKPSAPYAQTSYPPPADAPDATFDGKINPEYGGDQKWGDTAPFSHQTQETGARFNPKSKLRDPIFLILFLANLAGWAVVSGLAIREFVKQGGLGGTMGTSTGTSVTLDYHTVYLLLCCCALALAVAVIWLGMVRAFARVILEISLAATVVLNIGICIWYFIQKYWSGAIIFLVIAVFSVISYFFMRSRIPLARLMLQTTIDITKRHPSVYVVVLLGLIVQTALSAWYAFTCIAIYVKWTPGSPSCATSSCSSGKVAGLVFYVTFSFFWTTQVVANVVLCTLAGGIFGGWYYYGDRMNDGTGLPKNASAKAFGRATTLSLGSIAFGSLIVAILEMIQTILRAVQNAQAQEGSMVGQILACCALCCINCITGLLEWFNKYAYIEIALYGKPYIAAAKDTWGLMKDRGIDALVNDSLVGMVIVWGSYLNGFLCGLFAYVYLRYTKPTYNADGQYTAPVILFAFLIGINLSLTIGRAIDAGVSTIFVGLGEHPMVLQQRAPALFDMIGQKYPKVFQGVQRHS